MDATPTDTDKLVLLAHRLGLRKEDMVPAKFDEIARAWKVRELEHGKKRRRRKPKSNWKEEMKKIQERFGRNRLLYLEGRVDDIVKPFGERV